LLSRLQAPDGASIAGEGFVAGRANRISYSTDFAAAHDIELRTELSQKEDADVAAPAVEVTAETTQLAAFQIRGAVAAEQSVRLSR
jgi:hypothetical protein